MPSSNSSSHIENLDPCHLQQMQNYLSQIIQQLGTMDEVSDFSLKMQKKLVLPGYATPLKKIFFKFF